MKTETVIFKLDEHQLHKIMAAIDTLNTNITNLTTSVTKLTAVVAAAIPDINPLPGTGATEAQVQAAADAVAAQGTLVDAQTAAITTAITPVVSGAT